MDTVSTTNASGTHFASGGAMVSDSGLRSPVTCRKNVLTLQAESFSLTVCHHLRGSPSRNSQTFLCSMSDVAYVCFPSFVLYGRMVSV